MGFGLLFLGYFATTMMSIPLSGLLPIDLGNIVKMIGYFVIIIAAKKLSEYHDSFKSLMLSSALMVGISAFAAFFDLSYFISTNQILSLPYAGFVTDVMNSHIIDYISFAASIIFVSMLCLSIKNIAFDTGVNKIYVSATRNFVFYCIFFVVQAISFMPFEWIDVYSSVFVAALLIIELLCNILNLYMIFSCYAKICDSSDVEMKQKPSRFEFVNENRKKREEERQKILDEYNEKQESKKEKKK